MSWKIDFYRTENGSAPVADFIERLDNQAKAKLLRQTELLEEFGPELGMPHSRPLGDSLYELRIRGRHEIRVFYIFAQSRTIYLLHGFIKKSQTLPSKELKIALVRRRQLP